MKLENVFMLLPNRTVGFGSIEIEGDTEYFYSDGSLYGREWER